MWTEQIGAVLDGVREAGAAVIGFDIILPTSVASLDRTYDREFLLALRRAANENKIVLAKVQHQVKPIAPFPSQSVAVSHQRNIRSVNLNVDTDGIIRHVPLFFDAKNSDGTVRQETSLALELAPRKAGEAPRIDSKGGAEFLGDYRIPGGRNNTLSVNFDGGASIPTFSIADIHACVAAGNEDFLKQIFEEKSCCLASCSTSKTANSRPNVLLPRRRATTSTRGVCCRRLISFTESPMRAIQFPASIFTPRRSTIY